CQQLNSPYF
nr:immunoglobulin light chain junction region [Homo sapiens]